MYSVYCKNNGICLAVPILLEGTVGNLCHLQQKPGVNRELGEVKILMNMKAPIPFISPQCILKTAGPSLLVHTWELLCSWDSDIHIKVHLGVLWRFFYGFEYFSLQWRNASVAWKQKFLKKLSLSSDITLVTSSHKMTLWPFSRLDNECVMTRTMMSFPSTGHVASRSQNADCAPLPLFSCNASTDSPVNGFHMWQ